MTGDMGAAALRRRWDVSWISEDEWGLGRQEAAGVLPSQKPWNAGAVGRKEPETWWGRSRLAVRRGRRLRTMKG